MDTVLPNPDERARKNFAVVMQRLASVGMRDAAEYAGIDESTVSRWKEKTINQFSRMLAKLGLKIVPVEMRCYNPKDIEAVFHQAQCWMNHINSADRLVYED